MHRSAHTVRKCFELQEKIAHLLTTHKDEVPEGFIKTVNEIKHLADKLEIMAIAQRQHVLSNSNDTKPVEPKIEYYELENGLYYYNSGTGKLLPKGRGAILLTIEIKDDDYFIANYSNGQANESYRHTGQMQAILDMTALMCGFQPPRGLRHRDIPSGQTQSESVSLPEASGDSTTGH